MWGPSQEMDEAEEDLPPALGAGVRPPQLPGVVAWLGLHAGAAMREDLATVRGRGRQLRPLARRGVGLHQRAGRPVAVAGAGQQRLVHLNTVAVRPDEIGIAHV